MKVQERKVLWLHEGELLATVEPNDGRKQTSSALMQKLAFMSIYLE
jgi:hypothetical protein